MRRCPDLEPVRRLLLQDRARTFSIYNTIFGRTGDPPTWVRVDDPENPRAVICRSRAITLYSADRTAGRALLDRVPRNWRPFFRATPSWACDHLARTRPILWTTPCFGYALLDPKRLHGEVRHRVGRLRPDDVEMITAHWPYHRGRRRSPHVRRLIERVPSAVIRRNGRPIAWALLHDDGSMGFLHVLEEWRHRGLARSLALVLCRRVLARGLTPFVFIETRNRPSLHLTAGLGFERVGRYTWFGAGPLKQRSAGRRRAARAAR
jgi:GNAT superfamily N-acetyltransferase